MALPESALPLGNKTLSGTSVHKSSFINIQIKWLLCLPTDCGGRFVRLERHKMKVIRADGDYLNVGFRFSADVQHAIS